MTKLLQSRSTWWLMAAGALALLLGAAVCVEAAPAAQGQGRIAVVVYPDLAGDGDDPSCPGCDGVFSDDDTRANTDDPLPSLRTVLRNGDGAEVDQSSTTGLANGRQVTFFTVPAPGTFDIALEQVPSDWESCPGEELTVSIAAEDFDATTGIATVEFHLRRVCAGGTAAVSPEATAETAVDVTAAPTVEPSETAVAAEVVPTTAPTAAAATEAAEGGPRGAIRGVTYVDQDGDGKLTAGEPGLGAVTLRLVGGGTSTSQVSAGAGTFAFPGLGAGLYDVSVVVPDGYVLTGADRYADVAVEDETVLGIDFGLAVATTAPPAPVEAVAGPDAMPGTGVQVQPRGGLLVGLAVVAGLLGALGLSIENRRGRRSSYTAKGMQ